MAEEGLRPAQAVAESLAALNAIEAMGLWPGPRDEIAERGVGQVRRRWAKVQKRAKQQAQAAVAEERFQKALAEHKEIDVDRVRSHLARLAELADEPMLTSGLEAVLKLSSAGRSSTAKIARNRNMRSSHTPKAKSASPKAAAKAKPRGAPKPRRTKRRRLV